MNIKNIKPALEKVKELIDFHIDSFNNFEEDDYDKYKNILDILLQYECECDSYNGFNCGCGNMNALYKKAIDELDKVFCCGCEYENLDEDELGKPAHCYGCKKGSKIKI